MLVVIVGRDDAAGDWHVKYGGTNLSLAYAQPKSASVTNTIWYLPNPTVGTANLFVGVDSWWGATATVTAFVLDNVDLTNPIKSINQLSYGYAHPPLTLAADAAAGEFTISAVTIFSGTAPAIVPGSGQVPLSNVVDSTSNRFSRHSIKVGESTGVSNTWVEVSEQAAMVAMVLRAASAGASPTLITSANSTQHNVSSSVSASQSTTTFVAASNSSQANSASAVSIATTAAGTITLPPFYDWHTGTPIQGETGTTVWVSDDITGALVAKIPGVSFVTDTACPVSHASIVAGTAYYVRAKRANGAQAGWTFTAT